MAKDKDQEFLQKALEFIVDNPKDVTVDRTVNELGVLLTVNANKEDYGTIIGKQGQNINALRLLVKIIGRKNDSLVSVKLADDEPKKEDE